MKNLKRSSGPYLLWLAIFILVPLFMVLGYGLTDGTGAWSGTHFQRFFTGGSLRTLWRSVRVAFVTTSLCLLIGYPAARLLSRMRLRYRTTALMLVVIPMWMNFLLRTYAWVTILSKNGLLNHLLAAFGREPLDLLYTEGAVVLGMVYNFLPFMILPIYTVLEKMDADLLEAARDLGCNERQVFWRVVFPLSLPGVASGISMVFIPAISTFEITGLLGGNKANLIGNVIEQQFTVTGDWHYGSAMAMVLMVFLVLSLLFERREV
uniref:ABC transporter permease n=1 Tax=Ndongobacter massiliensis TaxID=1871025 RepID=UPI000931AC3F|nr:ABC transporter permease [Ndongobacter massiliensis]